MTVELAPEAPQEKAGQQSQHDQQSCEGDQPRPWIAREIKFESSGQADLSYVEALAGFETAQRIDIFGPDRGIPAQ